MYARGSRPIDALVINGVIVVVKVGRALLARRMQPGHRIRHGCPRGCLVSERFPRQQHTGGMREKISGQRLMMMLVRLCTTAVDSISRWTSFSFCAMRKRTAQKERTRGMRKLGPKTVATLGSVILFSALWLWTSQRNTLA